MIVARNLFDAINRRPEEVAKVLLHDPELRSAILSDEQLAKQLRMDLLKDNQPAFDRGMLELRLTAVDGTRLYGFRNLADLPLMRFARKQEYLSWMSAAVSADELGELMGEAKKAIASGLNASKNAARLGMIVEEIEYRRGRILHLDLLYQFLATQLVAEYEEDVHELNPQHHERKVEQLRELAQTGGAHFFFQLPELKTLVALWGLRSQEWQRYSDEFQKAKDHHGHVMTVLGKSSTSAASASGGSEKTSSKVS